jgi:hypothetical protein
MPSEENSLGDNMYIKYETIKKEIDNWDPVGLLNIHAPHDEYDNESKEIYYELNDVKNINKDELSKIIFNIFTRSFGNDVFNTGLDKCDEIAVRILTSSKI